MPGSTCLSVLDVPVAPCCPTSVKQVTPVLHPVPTQSAMRITSPTCLGPTCTTISLPGTVCLQGELPSDWGKSGAFRALEHLLLHNNDVSNSCRLRWLPVLSATAAALLPDTCTRCTALLQLTMDESEHVLAKAWADAASFPSLKVSGVAGALLLPQSVAASAGQQQCWAAGQGMHLLHQG